MIEQPKEQKTKPRNQTHTQDREKSCGSFGESRKPPRTRHRLEKVHTHTHTNKKQPKRIANVTKKERTQQPSEQ